MTLKPIKGYHCVVFRDQGGLCHFPTIIPKFDVKKYQRAKDKISPKTSPFTGGLFAVYDHTFEDQTAVYDQAEQAQAVMAETVMGDSSSKKRVHVSI